MTRGVVIGMAALLALVGGWSAASAQSLYATGQNIQPVFEGWERNPDGTVDMLFGYLNRNYVEEPHVAVGPNNAFAPGPADRGQPTYFYPRRQSFVFRVTVPADWGSKDLVWTVTHNGRTSTATGSLWPVWEIDEGVWRANRGSGITGRTSKKIEPNQRPSIKVVGDATVTSSSREPLTLTAAVSDDGKPGKRPPPPARRPDSQPQASAASVGTPSVPARARREGPNTQDKVSARAAYETGLAVTWILYRGAGTVTFEPRVTPVKPDGDALAGKAVTSVRFNAPGTYVLRAVADDGVLTTPAEVTVIVKDAATSAKR